MALNLFELAAKITLDKKDFDKGLQQGESSMSKFGTKLNKAFKSATIAATGLAVAGGAAFAKLTKSAFKELASYEQLLGGVETLFKASSTKVEQYAAVAYKTAGLSANEYMETVTSFSASLLQSLGGDTSKAADVADMAIQDMSDNANKMGTDMSAIQSAYQGFAKQNYTMLDNLKLGYGGTKTEMERLLTDAGKLTGKKYDISNLADVYDAIHAIQTEMGITGTTAKEASTTIEGSWKAVSASFKNFLSGNGGAEGGYQALISSLDNALDLSIDRLSRLVPRLAKQGGEIVKSLSGKLPKLLEALMPGVEAGASALMEMLGDVLPTLITSAGNLLPSLVTGVANLVGKLAKKMPQILKSLWSSLKGALKNLGGLIFGTDSEGAVKWPTWDDVKEKAKVAWNAIVTKAAQLGHDFGALVFGTDEKGNVKWPTWEDVKDAAKTAWNAIKEAAASLGTEFGKLVFGTDENGDVKWPTAEEVRASAEEWWKNTAQPAIESVEQWVLKIFSNPAETVEQIKTQVTKWWNDLGLGTALSDGLTWTLKLFGVPEESIETIKSTITDWWNTIVGAVTDGVTWLLSLPTMPDAHVAGQTLRATITKWWTQVKFLLGNILSLLFSVSGPEDEDGSDTEDMIAKWWDETVVPLLKGVINFTLGLFGLPSVDQMVEKIKAWWAQVVKKIHLTLGITPEVGGVGGDGLGVTPSPGYGQDPTQETVGSTPWYVSMPSFFAHAAGEPYVPYDNYVARLHRGEMVLNKSRADAYRSGQGSSSLGGLTAAIVAAVREGMSGASVNAYIDGKDVTDTVNRRQAADMYSRRFAV